ncbi:hypothetical protein ASE93_08300 [Serratia sp. Leaf50]|nr:hypothetical protein ASE93_08300 [Serratia sp. Leaf50]
MENQNIEDKKQQTSPLSRRHLLQWGAATLTLGPIMLPRSTLAAEATSPPLSRSQSAENSVSIPHSMAQGWHDLPPILARIKAPKFPHRDFTIADFGVKRSGEDASQAIKQAIEACHQAGGGRVVIPQGIFYTGPIWLKSGVNLHLADGATLKFFTDPQKYPNVLTRWEGIECMNFSPLIYAIDAENIAITGKGTLDGQASKENWWAWKQADGTQVKQYSDMKKLMQMGEQGMSVAERVFGLGHFLRPNFIQPYHCKNVLIEDITIINSPMWELHPVLSENITIRGVQIHSHGPNNDGCDPECCRDVLIENCIFDTGDDCIAIKSGKNNDGRRVNTPSINIVIRGCKMLDGHGGVVLGSECSGNIYNVFVEDCEMDSPHLDRVLRFKNNAVRGGKLENVFMRNIRVGQVSEAILTVDFLYEEGEKGPYKPVVRNVYIEQVTSKSSPRVMYIASFKGAEIDNIHFSDSVFSGITSSEVMSTSGTVSFRNVVIEPKNRPQGLNSRLPAQGW